MIDKGSRLDELEELDIAECGKFRISEETLGGMSDLVTNDIHEEEHIDYVTGQTGNARRKTFCKEWLFFPAGERQFSMVIDYWHAKSSKTYKEIVELERENKRKGGKEYKRHAAENEYGRRKGELMERLSEEVERHLTIFSLAKDVMSQHSPHPEYVNDHYEWAYADDNITPGPLDHVLGVSNYRALGPRPSMIDSFIHRMFKQLFHLYVTTKQRLFRSEFTKETIYIAPWVYRLISDIFIITVALMFLVLPLMIIYLMEEMSPRLAVSITAGFCLLFCVGSFVLFGSINTDHKFLLLFAYTGVMATLLSNTQIVESPLRGGVGGGSVVRIVGVGG
ncbi:hypothetical protein QBC38DRAFT_2631 [Podospora fimiseda]|uniref:DUF6594 domain-containing protein n=1 Tax=Podospora fimiseda TaxID=252190 RepID=A0AAN7BZG6_9PEZI|nr:hypothetical protein QBC38DRAFT_2631 [Podospora fimiseda]